jgi:HJR/Mrr/RecB family endonuclease
MDWREFEHWVAEQLKRAGFEIKLTSGSNDGGVDVIGIAPNRQIQAFMTGKKIGR